MSTNGKPLAARKLQCRQVSLNNVCRDLMKWCSRLEQHVMKNRIQLMSELIFIEAVDCYCACLPVTAGRMQMMFEIGKRLNFSRNEV